jgi:hypothetical protein
LLLCKINPTPKHARFSGIILRRNGCGNSEWVRADALARSIIEVLHLLLIELLLKTRRK